MALVDRFFPRNEATTLSNPAKWLTDFFGGKQAASGVTVNERTALYYSTVYACIRVLAETLAMLPLPVYERLPTGGKGKALRHPLWNVLHDLANEQTSSFIFRETLMNHVLTYGNAYAWIQRDGSNRVVGLWILRPDLTRCERLTDNSLQYRTTTVDGRQVVFAWEDVFHIPGLGFDGLNGYSPIRMAQEAIGLGLATEEFGARFFSNGANAGGILEHPNVLSETAHANLKRDAEENYANLSNSHKLMILEEGMKFSKITVPPNEAQFLETRKFQRNEICGIYRVPPHLAGDLERATFSNIEHQDLGFVKHTMLPWFRRWEQQIMLKLLKKSERATYFAEFNVDGLLRGDYKSRQEGLAVMRQNGIINGNQWRELENLNPIEDQTGEEYWRPTNMYPPKDEAGKGVNNP
jgi:HK97 family phage portal protein